MLNYTVRKMKFSFVFVLFNDAFSNSTTNVYNLETMYDRYIMKLLISEFHGYSLIILILLLAARTVWLLAVLPTFRRYMLPISSGYK
jgi:hypothetical protein